MITAKNGERSNMKICLTTDNLNQLLKYLGTKPFIEAAPLVEMLQKSVTTAKEEGTTVATKKPGSNTNEQQRTNPH